MTMMTHTPDSAQSWRDLAAQLPAELIARYERWDQYTEADLRLAFPTETPEAAMRKLQQDLLDDARGQIRFAHIPLPPQADNADTWQDDGTGTWARTVFGTRRSLEHMTVSIDGVQSEDGYVRWSMYVHADDQPTTADQALAFSAMLMHAADELENLQ